MTLIWCADSDFFVSFSAARDRVTFDSHTSSSVPHYHVVSKKVQAGGKLSPVFSWIRALLVEGIYRRMGEYLSSCYLLPPFDRGVSESYRLIADPHFPLPCSYDVPRNGQLAELG